MDLLKEIVLHSKMPYWDVYDPTVPTFWACTACQKDWYGKHAPSCPIGRGKELLGLNSNPPEQLEVVKGIGKGD